MSTVTTLLSVLGITVILIFAAYGHDDPPNSTYNWRHDGFIYMTAFTCLSAVIGWREVYILGTKK